MLTRAVHQQKGGVCGVFFWCPCVCVVFVSVTSVMMVIVITPVTQLVLAAASC